ncbi:hypothetical protein [Rhodopirellula sp. MGV]|uniref:hypothetical protein n=1 Tax=Rhodopirellula sp. MGV TaxID=2023130 RepID=UPI000B97BFCB|nr:hypothetical protein [Rhodopirellula sp. MGV]OYP34913.1 hypothetical protein CGZ80_12835 [Rhodopirellula sp. MGV]PNY38190.1 hypothetical protein C2E31_04115 [Rhodopirellula baltica]
MNRKRPNGLIAVMFVLMLAFVVGTFAISLGRRAVDVRRHQSRQKSIRELEAAIEAVHPLGLTDQQQVRLPFDAESDTSIIVKASVHSTEEPNRSVTYEATFSHGDRSGFAIQRSRDR